MHILVFIRFSDADLYETLTEDILVDQISKAMGPIDSQIVSDVMEICSLDVNRNESASEDDAKDVTKSMTKDAV